MEESRMNLKKIRKHWEEETEVLLTLTSPAREIYTLTKGNLENIERQWHVFRYSRSGSTWQDCSVVASHFPDMQHCLEYLNTEFEKFYPDST